MNFIAAQSWANLLLRIPNLKWFILAYTFSLSHFVSECSSLNWMSTQFDVNNVRTILNIKAIIETACVPQVAGVTKH